MTWLSMPVTQTRGDLLREVKLSDEAARAAAKAAKTIHHYYSHTPFFEIYGSTFIEFFDRLAQQPNQRLLEVAASSIGLMANILGDPPPSIYYSSQLVGDRSVARTSRIVQCAAAAGCSNLLAGWGGTADQQVHDLNEFERAGLKVIRFEAKQLRVADPELLDGLRGTSTMHCLFLFGSDRLKRALAFLRRQYYPCTN